MQNQQTPMTPINNSFDFYSAINLHQLNKSQFSITCIFCTSADTQGLSKDGTFRQCLKCRKQFQCIAQPANNLQNIPSLAPIKPVTTFQSLQRPLFIEPKKYEHTSSFPKR